mgnify:CR=1 FL=1
MTVIVRETRETKVRVEIDRGTGSASVQTGVPFLDHMLTTLARYSGLDVRVTATGDLRHHTIEDVAIAFGAAIAAFVPPTAARYGERVVPMDDTVVHASLTPNPGRSGGRASMMEMNVIGTMQLLAACQQSESVRRPCVSS